MFQKCFPEHRAPTVLWEGVGAGAGLRRLQPGGRGGRANMRRATSTLGGSAGLSQGGRGWTRVSCGSGKCVCVFRNLLLSVFSPAAVPQESFC